MTCHVRIAGIPARAARCLTVAGAAAFVGSGVAQCPVGFAPVVTYPAVQFARCLAAADFDRDGVLDLALGAFGTSNVMLYRGVGNGTFLPAVPRTNTAGGVSIAAADMNLDGRVDIVTATQGNAITVMLGNGDLTFQTPTSRTVTPSVQYLIVADFNADGRPDVAVSQFMVGQPALSILLGNGDGTLQTPLTSFPSSVSLSVAAGDMNRDGKTDLVLHNQGPFRASVLLGNGNGTFTTSYNASLTSTAELGVADFNRDGKPDVACCNPSQGSVTVLLGDGAGALGAGTNFPVAGQGIVIPADLDRDGAIDLVIPNLFGRQVSVLRGTGTGSFSATTSSIVAANNSVSGAAVGDFNGDGRLDIATANYNSASIGVLLQTAAAGPTITSQPVSLAPIAGTGAVFTVGATGSGTLSYSWRMNGVVLANGPVISGQGTPSVTISPVDGSMDLSALHCVVTDGCGSVSSWPAALCVRPACIADINGDGGIDGTDVEYFFERWEAGC